MTVKKDWFSSPFYFEKPKNNFMNYKKIIDK